MITESTVWLLIGLACGAYLGYQLGRFVTLRWMQRR